MNMPIDSILDVYAPQPRGIRLYLRTHGWESTERFHGQPTLWRLPGNDGTYEVIAPSSKDTGDFRQRVSELLRTLAIAEDRSPADVLRDISTQAFDIQYYRTEPDSPPGTAPLRDAADKYAAVSSLYSASAVSLEDPRPVHPARRPARTQNLMKQVLAGPTSEGSYVISVWTPIPPRLTQDEDSVLFETNDEPYERRATVQLHRALSAVRSAIDDGAEIDTFIDRAAHGVSANLCESLVLLSGDAAASPFDVRFTWALDRPVRIAEPVIRFGRDDFRVLKSAAQDLRALQPEQDVRLRGNVVRLEHDATLGPGVITIAGVASDDPSERMRRVYVTLEQADYDRAVNAHQQFLEVEVTGSLTQRGTRSNLSDPREFLVLPGEAS
jgi:hypothetical protein